MDTCFPSVLWDEGDVTSWQVCGVANVPPAPGRGSRCPCATRTVPKAVKRRIPARGSCGRGTGVVTARPRWGGKLASGERQVKKRVFTAGPILSRKINVTGNTRSAKTAAVADPDGQTAPEPAGAAGRRWPRGRPWQRHREWAAPARPQPGLGPQPERLMLGVGDGLSPQACPHPASRASLSSRMVGFSPGWWREAQGGARRPRARPSQPPEPTLPAQAPRSPGTSCRR